MVDDVLDLNMVEAFQEIIQFGVVYVFNGFTGKIDSNAAHLEHGLPVLLGFLIGGT